MLQKNNLQDKLKIFQTIYPINKTVFGLWTSGHLRQPKSLPDYQCLAKLRGGEKLKTKTHRKITLNLNCDQSHADSACNAGNEHAAHYQVVKKRDEIEFTLSFTFCVNLKKKRDVSCLCRGAGRK